MSWEWYQDANTARVFIHCLIMANWKAGRFRGTEVPRGSFVTSLPSLCEDLNLTTQNVRTAINHLKSTGEITIKSTNKFSIVSIVNWEKYQGYEEDANKQINKQTNKQLTNNQQTTNNIKEIKNIRNKEYFNSDKENARNKDFLDLLSKENKNGKH